MKFSITKLAKIYTHSKKRLGGLFDADNAEASGSAVPSTRRHSFRYAIDRLLVDSALSGVSTTAIYRNGLPDRRNSAFSLSDLGISATKWNSITLYRNANLSGLNMPDAAATPEGVEEDINPFKTEADFNLNWVCEGESGQSISQQGDASPIAGPSNHWQYLRTTAHNPEETAFLSLTGAPLTESPAGSVHEEDAGDSESLGDVLPSPFKTEEDILLESEDTGSGLLLQCSCVVHSPVDYPRIVLRDPWVNEHDCPFLSRPGTDASSDVGPLDSDW
ncbi:hypothetical protein DFP72DRAFT_1117745 [Ephemerocybe angulata]|uniref:Uncharacterized protein n=1 Tax=Ephemerocybe angulata TaxID=980116 RepID=A0A8H6I002_9AGAR|nr:hypothetical protein DFP72DRAFT_1117745 [Tulosesus angulatus]